ncbi:MAG: hypothetical protein HC895_01430 [Leptolyngbyaceae cyanobacterium SM1_3_5]|nr:hypothetical protein [Leptolyngbyaceae cyanobacterium SM1_3_5]
MTIEEAIAHPFIQHHCALIYTTASHQTDWPKLRLVFRLPEFVKDIDTYEAIVKLLLAQLPHDPACKDGVRVFYGNTAAEFPLINPEAHLPADWIEQAQQQAQQEQRDRAMLAQVRTLRREQFRQFAQAEDWDTDRLIEQALECIPPRSPGSNNYQECLTVLQALDDYYDKAQAEAIAERWSPSIAGTTWNIPQKLKSFKRSGTTIGSLFHIAKQYGFRFPERRHVEVLPDTEPDPTAYHAYCQWEAEQERIEAAIDCERQRERQEQQQARKEQFSAEVERVQAMLSGLRVYPTLEVTGQFIEPGLLQLPEKSGIILTDGGMGCRKTSVGLKGLVEQHRDRTGFNSTELAFVPRNSLGKQSGREIDLPHREYQGDGYLNRGTLCFESIHRVDLNKISEQPLVLVDEASQGFEQILFGETCRDHHAFTINRMRRLFQRVADRGGWIVLSEDGLTNLELDLVQEASGLEVVSFLKFNKLPHHRELTLYTDASMNWKEINHRLFKLEQTLLLCTDNRDWARQIYQRVEALGGDLEKCKIRLIERDTAHEDYAQLLALDPQDYLDTYQPRLTIHTPVISSGVSIVDANHQIDAVGFHLSHLPARSAKQLIERLRTDVPRFGYVATSARVADNELHSSLLPDLIRKDVQRNQKGVATLTHFAQYAISKAGEDSTPILEKANQLEAQRDDRSSDYGFFLWHWSRYQARANYERRQIREQLIDLWEKQGYQIKLVEGKDAASKLEREEEKVKLNSSDATAFAVADTSDMTPDQARDILAMEGSRPTERLRATKRLLQEALPGCPLDQVDFVLKTLIENHGEFRQQAERYWLMLNPEAAKWIDRWGWFSIFSTVTKRDEWAAPKRLSVKSAQAKLLAECPLAPFIRGEVPEWGDHTPEAIAVQDWALRYKSQFWRYFKLTIKANHSPQKTVNKILRKVGIESEKSRRIGGSNGKGQKWLYHAINLQDADRTLILEALSERFLKRLADKEGCSPNSILVTPMGVRTTPLATVGGVAAPNSPRSDPGRVEPTPAPMSHASVTEVVSPIEPLEAPQISIQSSSAPAIDTSLPTGDASNQLQGTQDDIEIIAALLEAAESPARVKEVRLIKGMTLSTWKAATKCLVKESRQRVKRWMNELFDSGELIPSST